MPRRNTTSTTPTAAPVNINDLTYGIEIECGIDHDAPVSVGGHGCGNAVRNLPAFNGSYWRADYDSSVSVRDRKTCEFVSPILRGGAGLDNIREVTEAIKVWGGSVNRSCGLHIHVGFPTDSIDALRRLYRIVGRLEEGLFAATGTPERARNSYCKPIKATAKRTPWHNLSIRTPTDKYNAYYSGHAVLCDRYHLINLTNYLRGDKPTVEFRVFSGSINPDKIAAWVRLCLTIVEMALSGVNTTWDVPERTLLYTPEGAEPETRGQAAVNYLISYLWNQSHKGQRFGNLDHARYTKRRAAATLRGLATRHDERSGLRPRTPETVQADAPTGSGEA